MLYNKYLTVDFAAERWGNTCYCTLPESLKIIYEEVWHFGILWFNKGTKGTVYQELYYFGILWFIPDTKGRYEILLTFVFYDLIKRHILCLFLLTKFKIYAIIILWNKNIVQKIQV